MANVEGHNVSGRGEPNREIEATGQKPIELTSGYLPFDTPSFVDEAELFGIQHRKEELRQTGRAGLPRYQRAVAADFEYRHNFPVNHERVLATSGSSGALRIVFSAFNELRNPQNQLWVPELGYNYGEIAQHSGLRTRVRYPLKDGMPDPQAIGRLLEADNSNGIIVLATTSPANPSGRVTDRDTLGELAERVKHKNKDGRKVLVVEDIVFSTSVYDGKEHPSLFPMLPEDVVLVDSTSKRLANLQNGWAIAPDWLADDLVTIRDDTGGVPTSGQYAAAHVLEEGGRPYIAEARDKMEQRRNIMAEGLSQIDGLEFDIPEGGFFFYIRQPYGTSEEFAAWMKKYGVHLNDGIKYTRAKSPEECNGVRASFAVRKKSHIVEAMSRMKQGVDEWDLDEARRLVQSVSR